MKLTANKLIQSLQVEQNADRANHSQRFFKTGKGEYAEGDVFLGITVPVLRSIAREFRQLDMQEVKQLLASPYHEARFCALVIMNTQFKAGGEVEQEAIYQLYIEQTDRINNWDLVDVSAARIVGAYLGQRDRGILYQLAKSADLWERRISIISTHYFIRQDDFKDTLKISEILVNDPHDLIHKAVGWMLREVGNRDRATEESFLARHYLTMPRTMLRYAIEKFPPERRQQYLKGKAF